MERKGYLDTLTLYDSAVNPLVFTFSEYRLLVSHECGEMELSPPVERAYMRLMAALNLEQPLPGGVPLEWWEEQKRYWCRGEEFWQQGKEFWKG
jgi:hypothetical protein